MNPFLIAFIVVSIVVVFLFTYGKRVQMDRLAVLIECKDFEQFDKVANSFLTKVVVKHYDLESAKLNSYIARKDRKKTDEQFDFLLKVAKNDDKVLNLEMRAFEYYLYDHNKNKAKTHLKTIKEMNKEFGKHCQMEYDIVLEKSAEYIEQLEKDVESYSGQRRMVCLYLLKLSYENAGDNKKAKETEKRMKNK